MRKLLMTTAAVALLAGAAISPASAVGLTLTQVFDNSVGPQSTSNPCIIAGTNCAHQDPNMGYNLFSPNNDAAYNRFSTNAGAVNVAENVQGTPYTVGQLISVTGSTAFDIAINTNTAHHGETLNAFNVFIGGSNVYSFSGPASIDPGNNGNGFADYILSTVDLTGYAPGTSVLFQANWSGASDGAESFFLHGAVPVPGPLAGAGIPGIISALGMIGLAYRRRQRASAA